MNDKRPRRLFKRAVAAWVTKSWAKPWVKILVTVAVLVVFELIFSGGNPLEWHLPFGTAWITVIGGLWLGQNQSTRFHEMLDRLRKRGALLQSEHAMSLDDLTKMEGDLDRTKRTWVLSSTGACFVIGVVPMPFILLKHEPVSSVVVGMVIGGAGGLLAGPPIGRMLACSHFMRSLAREPVSIRATPGHVDGAAGLKPLGDYIIYQSLLLAIPSIFRLTWSLLFLIDGSSNDYNDLTPWYLGGLVLTIGVEIAAFTLPLSGVREMMKQQKMRALDDADTLVQVIADARKELERDLEADRRATVRDRLDLLTRKYIEIETMRTWPFDRGGRQQLTLGNLSLIAPAVAQVLIVLAGKS